MSETKHVFGTAIRLGPKFKLGGVRKSRYGTCLDAAEAIFGEGNMQIGVETSRAVENKRVFVVDSDEITRAALQFMLHDENETHELASLAEAFAKGAEWKPDLILLGLAIVLSEGAGVLGVIATRLPHAKILLVADAGQDALAQAYLKSGAHGVLTKPLRVESVRRKVDILLGRLTVPVIQLQVMATSAR